MKKQTALVFMAIIIFSMMISMMTGLPMVPVLVVIALTSALMPQSKGLALTGVPGAGEEEMTVEKMLAKFEGMKADWKADTTKAFDDKIKALNDGIEELKKLNEKDKADAVKLKEIQDNLNATIKALDLLQTRLKTAGGNSIPTRAEIKDQLKQYFEKNGDNWTAFRNGTNKSFGVQVVEKEGSFAGIIIEKAAATMTVGGSTGTNTHARSTEFVPGVVDLARNRPFIEAYANTTNTSSSRIVWTEKYNPQGSAAATAEGGLKPLVSFEIRTPESYAKKVTDKIKVSTEMLDDIDFIAGEIEKELMYLVDIKVDVDLLSGSGDATASATSLKGLRSYAGGYVLTTIDTSTPNNYDAIRAAIAQIVSLNFNPTHVFINPIDGANMDLVKDANGRPLAMEYKDPQGRVYRLQVVETNQVAQGYFLCGDMSKFVVRNYKPFAIQFGYVNDDFEKNLVTIIGERRLHAYVAANNVGAFIYDSFAVVKAAL